MHLEDNEEKGHVEGQYGGAGEIDHTFEWNELKPLVSSMSQAVLI